MDRLHKRTLPVSKNWKTTTTTKNILNPGSSNNGVQWDLYRNLQGNYLCIILLYSCSIFYVPYDACANACVCGCVCVWKYVQESVDALGAHMCERQRLTLDAILRSHLPWFSSLFFFNLSSGWQWVPGILWSLPPKDYKSAPPCPILFNVGSRNQTQILMLA